MAHAYESMTASPSYFLGALTKAGYNSSIAVGKKYRSKVRTTPRSGTGVAADWLLQWTRETILLTGITQPLTMAIGVETGDNHEK